MKTKFSLFYIILGFTADLIVHLTIDTRFGGIDIESISMPEYLELILHHPLAFSLRVLLYSLAIYSVFVIND